MCGIAGYKVARAIPDAVLGDLVEALHHRGPDSCGFHRDGEFAAGMCRLAVNDVEGGNQPLFGADGRVVLFYNGEIYNYWELRLELEAKGHVFQTRSDGEVICHLYQYYKENLFERLDGMFAVALWIAAERKLILARDIPGEKPLYYAELGPGEIAFASEITALKRFPHLDTSLDRQAIWDFLSFLWVPEPATVFRAIKALPRGHMLIVHDGNSSMRPYNNTFNIETFKPTPGHSIVDETRRVVEEAVHSRLLSDVPVGSFLSGGLDSSIVATLAARELGRLDTFCIAFEKLSDPYHGEADESAAAAQTAKLIGSHHHEIRVTAGLFRAELEKFCDHGDQPFAVSSGLGILSVAKAAREAGIKVLLSGDGADETFGGYSWYAHLDPKNRSGAKARHGIVSYQNFGLPIGDRLACIDRLSPAEKAWAWHYYAHEDEKAALFSIDFRDKMQSSLRHFVTLDGKGLQLQPLDFIDQDRDFYFPNEMLRKVDRMTMAYSVEGRVPFAAPAVLSHAHKLKFENLVGPSGTLKCVLRDAFSDILHDDVVKRPKHGFNVPIDHWLKNEWADLADSAFAPSSALSRMNIIAADAGQIACAMLQDERRLNGHTIFCMVMLNMWLERNGNGSHC